MNRKIMIVGRSGCGKDTLAMCLAQHFNMKQLISTTTRPPRYEGEKAHVFVTEKEAETMTERVAETVINGYQYFATKQQLDECDVYVVDPKGLSDVCERAPETNLCVVYVNASKKVRKQRAIDRAEDHEEAARVFDKRHADETKMFDTFEKMVYDDIDAFHEAYPTADVLITLENEKSSIELMTKKAELVNMFNNQMDLGGMFAPYVHRI